MESQAHGFKFEDILIDFIFKDVNIINTVNVWKQNNYTSIFDIPEYSYLESFFGKGNAMLTFSEEEYISSLRIPIDFPISIKSSKKSSSLQKKIEFGDIQRTIKNFSLINIKSFSIILIEYKQVGEYKKVDNVFISNINTNNIISKAFKDFTKKSSNIKNVKIAVDEIKMLLPGQISKNNKKKYRKNLKNIIESLPYLTSHVKIDSKNQRRVQCSIKRNILIESMNDNDTINTKIISGFFKENNISVKSPVRIRIKKKVKETK